MNKIDLSDLDLKIFTELDASDYCQINNIDSDNITRLNLGENKLTDISGIKLFKNLEILFLFDNKIKDISVLKYLKNIKGLYIHSNELTDISVLKYLKLLQTLDISYTGIKDISVIQYLTDLEILDIGKLNLESNQIQYINSLKNLKELYYIKGFKDMNIINQLNKNIII